MAEWKKVIVSGSAADLASLSLDTALPVGSGGTGASTLTDGGVLLGSGTGAVTALGQATNGQLVIGSTGADPVLATLTGGANISVVNSAGGIEIAATGLGSGTVTEVATAGTVNGLTLTGGTITTTGTITLGGTLSGIANSALTNDSVIIGSTEVDLGETVTTFTGLTSVTSTDFVGDLTGNADTATTATTANGVAANSVALGTDTTGDYVASLGAGTGVTIGSNTGETSSPTIAVNYGTTANTAAQGNVAVTFAGTSNEIVMDTNTFTTVGGGGNVTIGLADTISGDRTFSGDTITINKDLVVQGTASFQNTENLLVADQFILLNSGSAGTAPGGIVIQQATQDVGETFAWSSADVRWGVTGSFSADATTFSPDAFVNFVVEGAGNDPDSEVVSKYDKKGNMFVGNTGDVWIYV